MTKTRRLELLAMDLGAVELLVEEFQIAHGLAPDGDPGPKTLAELRPAAPGAAAPIPKTRSGVRDVYGSFSWTPGRGRSVEIDGDWAERNIRTFELHTGQRRRMHRLAGAELVDLFERACAASGYTPKSVQTFNPRRIKAKKNSKLSMHAYGIAVDFDPIDNPWRGRRKDGSPSLLRQNMAFVEVFEAAGWSWGGRWSGGLGDDMHFERRAPRLPAGVRSSPPRNP
jgi:hypothetical protein